MDGDILYFLLYVFIKRKKGKYMEPLASLSELINVQNKRQNNWIFYVDNWIFTRGFLNHV